MLLASVRFTRWLGLLCACLVVVGCSLEHRPITISTDGAPDIVVADGGDVEDADVEVPCDGGQVRCNGVCVDTQTSLANCGACGRACTVGGGDAGADGGALNATPTCAMGACGIMCATGFGNCDTNNANGCEAPLNTIANCGTCGRACPTAPNAAPACTSGACGITCNTGFGDCDGNPANGCETPLNTIANCGTCGRACMGAASASPTCNAGACGIVCNAGFGDCDGMAANGCEAALNTATNCAMCGRACSGATPLCMVSGMTGTCIANCMAPTPNRCGTSSCVNLQTDPNNCGSCGRVCPSGPNSRATCAAMMCGPLACDPGFADCDGNAANGCEVDTRSSPANCGACRNACPSGANSAATCAAGVCGIACNAGFLNCDAVASNGCEVNSQTSPQHCLVCGNACPGSPATNSVPTCSMGSCALVCVPNFLSCDGMVSNGCEVNRLTDPNNCGACGNVCTGGMTCQNGACACPAGTLNCSGTCRATATDVNNCGACGTVCIGGPNGAPACAAGACGITCNAGFGNCDGMLANGCETNTTNTVAHCGMCGRACMAAANASPTCAAGACGIACNPGFGNCDGNAANGCETNLATTTAHCGMCGNACPGGANATASCAMSMCGLTCAANFGNCDGMLANGCETNVTNTAAHCGMCGNACATPMNARSVACVASACVPTCNPGFTVMGTMCVDNSDTCAAGGGPVAIATTSGEIVITGTTTGRASNEVGTGACAGASGPDVVYVVTPATSGVLTVRLSTVTFNGAVYARTGACTGGGSTEVACANARTAPGEETLLLNVTAGTPLYLHVDGAAGASGNFALYLRLQNRCGDRALEIDGTPESCDDGNATSGDGCSNVCAMEISGANMCPAAGTQIPLTGGVQIYSGTTAGGGDQTTGACTAGVTANDVTYTLMPMITGRLRIEMFSLVDLAIYARATCPSGTEADCADNQPAGATEAIEVQATMGVPITLFVDGGANGAQGEFLLGFNLARCGDGSVGPGEECDDGNMAAGDGCGTTCETEVACVITEAEPNTSAAPQVLAPPAMCRTFQVNATMMMADDFYRFAGTAGQVAELETFADSFGDCPNPMDTLLELYGSPITVPPVNTMCSASGALDCADNINSSNLCSRMSFVLPETGNYVARVNGNVSTYSLRVTLRAPR